MDRISDCRYRHSGPTKHNVSKRILFSMQSHHQRHCGPIMCVLRSKCWFLSHASCLAAFLFIRSIRSCGTIEGGVLMKADVPECPFILSAIRARKVIHSVWTLMHSSNLCKNCIIYHFCGGRERGTYLFFLRFSIISLFKQEPIAKRCLYEHDLLTSR